MPVSTLKYAEVDGAEITQYTLSNATGISVSIINYGAIITSIQTPDKNGELGEVTLGYDDFTGYKTNPTYFGAVCGRVANRIAKGEFAIDGKTFSVAKNNGNNHLHGGIKGFDKCLWDAKADGDAVTFTYVSPDGDEGYPGKLVTSVTYALSDDDELSLDYHAETDAPTVVNLTNHTYFNLAGTGKILDHVIESPITHYTAVDAESIPTGELVPVKDTPFDFSSPTAIGARIESLEIGYDHNLCVKRADDSTDLVPVLKVTEPTTERSMEVFTTEPGIQLYTGWYIDNLAGRGGQVYNKFDGFCLETQKFPDACNQPNFKTSIVRPDAPYVSKTVYKFSSTAKKRKAAEQGGK